MNISTRTKLKVGLMFISILIIGIYLSQLNQTVKQSEHDRLMQEIVNVQASAIERRLSFSLASTYILAQEVKRSQGQFPNFEVYAQGILESIRGISSLQLAPNGIITKIHPLAGNEKAIGHNIIEDDFRRQEALLAIKEKRLTLAGPFTLVQGGIAVIGRHPVFLDKDGKDEFWGFTSALIFLQDLLSVTDLEDLENKGYSYQLSRLHPDTGEEDIFAFSKSSVAEHHLSQFIQVPNAQWTLRLSEPYSNPYPFAAYITSFLIALLFAIIFRNIIMQPEKLRVMVEQLEIKARELEIATEIAMQANKVKSEFLANISHELRTPMHGILSFSKFGVNRIDSVSQSKLLQYFINIQTSGHRLLNLLNDLLDLSKLEAGKMELETQENDLVDLFNHCVQEQQQRIKDETLTLVVNTPTFPVSGKFDKVRIAQVITNLLSNAIKFSPEGGVITVSIDKNDQQDLCFTIQDQGLGLPEGEIEFLFDAFVQSSTTKSTDGTGLGLAICKEIIELHNGRIWAGNSPDGGAIFEFTIPNSKSA